MVTVSHFQPIDRLYDCDLYGVVQNTNTPQNWKYEEITKKQKNIYSGWAPKIRKNTDKLQKRSFSGSSCDFSVFFSYVRGETGMWDLYFFLSCNFLVFLRVLYHPVEIDRLHRNCMMKDACKACP